MRSPYLLHHLIFFTTQRSPEREALKYRSETQTYFELATNCLKFSQALIDHQIQTQERVAIFLEKRIEFVSACFGSSCAGNIFVPVNPILKADQVQHILKDSGAKVFVTSLERYETFKETLQSATDVELVILTDCADGVVQSSQKIKVICWETFVKTNPSTDFLKTNPEFYHRHMVDTDAVSILYTSGSTGRPKGVVLSHRNMVFGAKNVSSYLENNADDTLLAVLPLSFDAGFSQMTTAFFSGARVILLNYILPKDILNTVIKEKVTGITAVPPLWMQIAGLNWPVSVHEHLRYFANTGGRMPFEILKKLRAHFPTSKPYLMYGLTESFRSTFLPPEEVDRRPNSIGKAIPNAEILVLKADGTPCGPREQGELVHRGALVGLGYWKDPEKTAERYKPLPPLSGSRPDGIVIPELGVFSGDLVEMDEEGFLYFIGRNDEMMKTSGYRVSPMEVEEVVYNSGLANEVAAFGVPHESLGQAIVISVLPMEGASQGASQDASDAKEKILMYCKEKMPLYMLPSEILMRTEMHPRNQNGKIDRKLISQEYIKKMGL